MEDFPFVVDSFCLGDYARFEISYEEMTENHTNLLFDEYRFGLSDLKAALDNMRTSKITRKMLCEEWYEHVFLDLEKELCLTDIMHLPEGILPLFNKDNEIMYAVYLWFRDEYEKFLDGIGDNEIPDYAECLRSIRIYEENRDLYVGERKYTKLMKRAAIQCVGSANNVDLLPPERRAYYKRFVNDLYRVKDYFGIKAKGLSHLIGNTCFRRDIKTALKAFSELYELDKDPRTAFILGDIYYGFFGGEPDYHTAFLYYCMSGFEGYTEALFKIAEMYAAGRGTIKNTHVAMSLMTELFGQTYNEFCKGNALCPFVEASVKLGRYYDGGIGTDRDPVNAFKYYNVARYAMERRLAGLHMPQDEQLRDEIDLDYRRVGKEVNADITAEKLVSDTPELFLSAMSDGYTVHAEVKFKDDEYKLVTRRNRKPGEDSVKGILVEFPSIGYCSLTNLVTESFGKKSSVWIKGGGKSFDAEEMVYDRQRRSCQFKYRGEVVAKISTSSFVARLRRNHKKN